MQTKSVGANGAVQIHVPSSAQVVGAHADRADPVMAGASEHVGTQGEHPSAGIPARIMAVEPAGPAQEQMVDEDRGGAASPTATSATDVPCCYVTTIGNCRCDAQCFEKLPSAYDSRSGQAPDAAAQGGSCAGSGGQGCGEACTNIGKFCCCICMCCGS